MKATELREKTTTELEELERQVRDELFRLRMKHYSGQLQRHRPPRHRLIAPARNRRVGHANH